MLSLLVKYVCWHIEPFQEFFHAFDAVCRCCEAFDIKLIHVFFILNFVGAIENATIDDVFLVDGFMVDIGPFSELIFAERETLFYCCVSFVMDLIDLFGVKLHLGVLQDLWHP